MHLSFVGIKFHKHSTRLFYLHSCFILYERGHWMHMKCEEMWWSDNKYHLFLMDFCWHLLPFSVRYTWPHLYNLPFDTHDLWTRNSPHFYLLMAVLFHHYLIKLWWVQLLSHLQFRTSCCVSALQLISPGDLVSSPCFLSCLWHGALLLLLLIIMLRFILVKAQDKIERWD